MIVKVISSLLIESIKEALQAREFHDDLLSICVSMVASLSSRLPPLSLRILCAFQKLLLFRTTTIEELILYLKQNKQ